MKKISVLITTHNSIKHIEECLDSILNQGFKDYEIIVIDNASQDMTREIARNKYPEMTLVKNATNYGISKAWNQGIALARGCYICCINDDVRLHSDFLANIYKAIESDIRVGAVQPKVLQPDGRHLDTAGIALSFLRRFYDIGNGKENGDGYNMKKYIFGACDATVVYRREALAAVGRAGEYFDEDFFCLVEDVDLSWRMQKAGWHTLYCPEAVCTHYRGLSRKKNGFTQYLNMRNRYLMIIKNESAAGFLRFLFILAVYDLWRTLYMAAVHPRYCLKALNDTLRLSSRMIKKRWTTRI